MEKETRKRREVQVLKEQSQLVGAHLTSHGSLLCCFLSQSLQGGALLSVAPSPVCKVHNEASTFLT